MSRDYAADNFGINICHPFLDDDLIKLFSVAPENWGRGLDLNNTKYALKNILKTKLDYPYDLQEGPHSYTYDIQPGFSIVNEFLNNSELKNFFINILKRVKISDYLDRKIFNLEYIANLSKKYSNSESFSSNEIRDLSSLIYHSNYLNEE